MSIYVASSWRNIRQPEVVRRLREEGYEVYDYRTPVPGDNGFHWSEVDGGYKTWTAEAYREALRHPISERGFRYDMDALRKCDVCVLVLPCGRSAHIEAGWACGAGKPVLILLDESNEPELMYKMAAALCLTIDEVVRHLGKRSFL